MLSHIAFIIDGNRRWAKAQGLPTFEGHHRGYECVKKTADWCFARGATYVTFFVFSTENWKRTQEEISWLMDLLLRALTVDLVEFQKREMRLYVVGKREGLSQKLVEAIEHAEASTAHFRDKNVTLCLNYGGHAEILAATQELIRRGVSAEELTADMLAQAMWTASSPPPDMIVRTSGEQRLSGFLTWSSVYSELLFLEKPWPAIEESDIEEIFQEFSRRERRFGQ